MALTSSPVDARGARPARRGDVRRRLAMTAIRDGLASLTLTGARRTVRRMDRLGFEFPDGTVALFHWYPVRGGRRAGDLEIVLGVMLGEGPLGARVAALSGAAGWPTPWVINAGGRGLDPSGSLVSYEILSDAAALPVAARVVADVRDVWAPLLELARRHPAAAAVSIAGHPWLVPGPAAIAIGALRDLAADDLA